MTRILSTICAILIFITYYASSAEADVYSSYAPYGYAVDFGYTPDFIRLRIPLKLLNAAGKAQLDKMLRQQTLPEGVKSVAIDSISLSKGASDHEIHFQADITAVAQLPIIGPVTVTCSLKKLDFVFPLSSLTSTKIVPTNIFVDCSNFGDIAALLDAPNRLAELVQKSIADALDTMRISSYPKLGDLGNLPDSVLIQGFICNDRNQDWLCIELNFPDGLLDKVIALVAAFAPEPAGPASEDALTGLLNSIESLPPPRKLSSRYISQGYSYPAKKLGGNGGYDDGDMILFGGLLCTAGVQEGCDLVAYSQSETGQFWRSPDQVEQWGSGQSNQFSNDAVTGLIAYFLKTMDKDRLLKFFQFLTTQSEPLPDPIVTFDHGTRSCLADNNFTCVIGGEGWNWFYFIADQLGVANSLPPDEKEPRKKYGQIPALVKYRALVNPLGPGSDLHLVGVDLWLRKIAGLWNSDDDLAAAVLAARSPDNPFFLMLHLGNDKRVVDAIRSKCSAGPQDSQDQWTWERNLEDSTQKPWLSSMRWDCIFLIKALGQIGSVVTTNVTQPPPQILYVPLPQGATFAPDAQFFSADGGFVSGTYQIGGKWYGYEWRFGDSQITYSHEATSSNIELVTADGLKWIESYLTYPLVYLNGSPEGPLKPNSNASIYLSPLRGIASSGNVICGDVPISGQNFVHVGTITLDLDAQPSPGVVSDAEMIGDVALDPSNKDVSSCLSVTADGSVLISGEKGGAVWGAFGRAWKQIGDTDFQVTAASVNGNYAAEYSFGGNQPISKVKIINLGGSGVDVDVPNSWKRTLVRPSGISADGKTMVGTVGTNPQQLFVWQANRGWKTIDDFVSDLGLTGLSGWPWKELDRVSLNGDGLSIMAIGKDQNELSKIIVIRY